MLKLKKSTKHSEIQIQFRPQREFLDRYLIFSLAFALSIHLIAGFLFHVQLFSKGQLETILPPTKTFLQHIQGAPLEEVVSVKVNTEGRLTPAQLAPPLSSPSLPPLLLSNEERINTFETLYQDLFLEIEKDLQGPYLHDIDIPVILPAVTLNFSGEIAELPLHPLSDDMQDFFSPRTFASSKLDQKRILFDVQVDAWNGKVFWYEPEMEKSDQAHMIVAEKILRKLSFATSPKYFVHSGTVEFIFTSGVL
ncbi:MAG: hypothetical protein BGO14_10570 [Chlamydiales bacterium 38-26]|nr:hypothetical protein [Chlamydiales bacterium]OJV11399.1 MAG: hypothetical protein BGO14_10570 [Chlamydiales bacterium 38-26]